MTFHVETDKGGYVAGKPSKAMHGTPIPGYDKEKAEQDAANRNKEAESLGIKTRYKVVETPEV